MPIIKGVDGVDTEMTPEEEAGFLATAPGPQPSYLDALSFYMALDAKGLYEDFSTWLAGQPNSTKFYFDKSPGFLETDSKIASAMTALSTTPSTFYTNALKPA